MQAKNQDATDVVSPGPTWQDPIKGYFNAQDIACMQAQGLDLADYATVKQNGQAIYDQVSSGNMPLGGPPWSAAWVSTFQTWMNNGYPEGAAAEST